ncbi:hypothetical protein GCM10010530_20640 [Kribbella aluminosa]
MNPAFCSRDRVPASAAEVSTSLISNMPQVSLALPTVRRSATFRYRTHLLGTDEDTKAGYLYAVGHANGTATVINLLGKPPAEGRPGTPPAA